MSEAIATTRSAPVGLAQERQPAAGMLWALDWLNFLMADVQNGLGPYLAVFLKGARNWDAGDIGVAMAVSNIASGSASVPPIIGGRCSISWLRGLLPASS